MDIVIEGKIDADEGMTEVIQTVLQLKSIQHAILRIASTDNVVTGRVAFSTNGYVLGGRLDESGETGYAAIRKLFSVSSGNFAVLDPGRTHVPEVNQTLWINADKVLSRLPNLPENPEELIDGDLSALPGQEKLKTGHINLKTKEWKEDIGPGKIEISSKARKFDPHSWQLTKVLLFFAILAALTAVGLKYGEQLVPYIPTFGRSADQAQSSTSTTTGTSGGATSKDSSATSYTSNNSAGKNKASAKSTK